MFYMISLKAQNKMGCADVESLIAFKKGIEAAIAKGSMKAAFTKVGGGTIFIVDSPSNGQLTLELRKHQITDAEVTPLVEFTEVLDAHIEFKKSGKVTIA